ncbi:glutamate 5-kinase [Sphingomonas piscis]|uniref:Glutamate 5-kinase n=1 Tax=Sphingomonas piscis TaxID=2714943 RepID=A0A6G7YNK0_9SPHN|nr:glutamate 5-kinase [Sphingomonas piscis]QIK78307.1 glutamate 5-kinase [Sphingomonas piscis]
MAQAAALTDSLAASLIGRAKRLVVKVGSSLLIERGQAREAWLATLASDIHALTSQQKQVVIVSSGAVALGRSYLGMKVTSRLDQKQAAAAAGQSLLMQHWQQAFAPTGTRVAQLLLTLDDTEQRRRWLNARATLEVLLGQGALPVINENDSVATDELRYGDNDRLSARAAQMVQADALLLLSDVDGLYSADPSADPNARHIPHLSDVDADSERAASGAKSGGVGTGGMRTKLMAASVARGSGCTTIIASGKEDHPIGRLLNGARATVISAPGTPATAYKQWIAGALAPAGTLTLDHGALAALQSGKSLLPAGITSVSGDFSKGACVAVTDTSGAEIARGVVNYSSRDIGLIKGQATDRIEERLGYRGPDVVIHRNDLVLK